MSSPVIQLNTLMLKDVKQLVQGHMCREQQSLGYKPLCHTAPLEVRHVPQPG